MEPERYASILVTKAGLGDVEKGSIGRKFWKLGVQADALRALLCDRSWRSRWPSEVWYGDGFYERAF